MLSLIQTVGVAIAKAEIASGKCLASDNFCLVIPNTYPDIDNIKYVYGYKVFVTVTTDIQLVALPHVKGNSAFVLALKLFNKEMENECKFL